MQFCMASSDYRWDDLRYFLAVWRQGSFTAAATALGVEQSTVSRRIAALEEALGGLLFDRTREGPQPTALAQEVSPLAERTESEARRVHEVSQGKAREVEGVVRLALVESFAVQLLIPELLGDLLLAHPRLRLDLLTSERTAELGSREADLALRFYRPTDGDLVARKLASLPRAVLAHREYIRGRRRQPERLDWIVLALAGAMSEDERYVAEHAGVPPRLRCTGHLAQVEAVNAGLGVAVLTKVLRRYLPALTEVKLPLPEPGPVELWLVAPRALRRVARVAAVWDFLEVRLPARLSESSKSATAHPQATHSRNGSS